MAEKFNSKRKEAEKKAYNDEKHALFEYKGPDPEGPRRRKKTD